MAFSAMALKEAVLENLDILKVSGIGFLVAMVIMVIIGIFAGLVSAGTISVPSGTNTTIQAFATTAGTVLTTIVGVFGTIASFVIIVAILKAFGIELNLGSNRV